MCTIFIGNIGGLTEYALIKLFQPFGTIKSIDYLWHKEGPMAGKPRSYCFIQFEDSVAAQKAIERMHDRQLAGKRLFVSLSSANSKDPDAKYMERLMREKRELTANAIDISDKNSAVKVASGGTTNRISAIESKLADLRSSSGPSSPSSVPLPNK